MNYNYKHLSIVQAGLTGLLIIALSAASIPAQPPQIGGAPARSVPVKPFSPFGTIIRVDNPANIRGDQVITVRETKTGATSQIHKKPSLPGRFPKFRIGETVYKNPQGDVAATEFPVRGAREDRVATGHMKTTFTLSDTGP